MYCLGGSTPSSCPISFRCAAGTGNYATTPQYSFVDAIWGVNSNNDVFMRLGVSDSLPGGILWRYVEGVKLKSISVGVDGHVWGTTEDDKIVYRDGITALNFAGTQWITVDPGQLKQVAIGLRPEHVRNPWSGEVDPHRINYVGSVWGVNAADQIFFRSGMTAGHSLGTAWQYLEGSLSQIAVGYPAFWNVGEHVWGVNSVGEVFFRNGVTLGYPMGTGWERVEGNLKWISVGTYLLDGILGNAVVWGVNSNDDVFFRTGIIPSRPTGTGWQGIPGKKMSQVAAGPDGARVWAVNATGSIFYRATTETPADILLHTGSAWVEVDGLLKQIAVGRRYYGA